MGRSSHPSRGPRLAPRPPSHHRREPPAMPALIRPHDRAASRPPRRPGLTASLIILSALAGGVATAAEPGPRPIDFNRDVRPILSGRCFRCHGPDAKQRKGLTVPLRLDTADGATADLGGY